MTTAYRFGSFELQADQRRLLEHGRSVALGDRAFDVLLALTEHAGQLMTKDELLGRVWPGLVVEENNLQVQVSALRKILGAAAIASCPGPRLPLYAGNRACWRVVVTASGEATQPAATADQFHRPRR